MTESGPQDPHAAREAAKYENPVASRELILEVLESSSGPMTRSALCQHFGLEDEDSVEAIRRRLIAMERDGQLIRNRRGAYGRVDKMDLVRGRVQGHRDGFGFVVPADGSPDVYLHNRQMRKVFDRDEVLVRLGPDSFRGKREGSVVEVLARNTQQVVGRLSVERGVHVVKPDNPRIAHDILIPPDQTHDAKDGQFVVVDIIQQPDRRNLPAGRVAEVLGDHLAPGMEIDVAIRSNDIPHEWPQAVLDQAATIEPEVKEEDKLNRIDLRDLPLVTIDGEDARDFDDAIYCEARKEGGWRLLVAIADVSHYVGIDTPLDREAQVRGNSVYFPDYVVPMLPEALSNGLCSLNPEVDRLCMVCEVNISAEGEIGDYQFFEGVMHSKARLTYTQVGQVVAERDNEQSAVRQQLQHVVPHLEELHRLFTALRKARAKRGAIDFETQETRIIFDPQRKIDSIVPVVRNDAHKMIEECMLAANVCAADFLEQHKLPSLYRIHEGPRTEKLELLHEFLAENGLSMAYSGDVSPRDYQEVLQMVQDRPDAHLIQTVMLRSMNQAVYAPENKGHFGLAYEGYTHFTSPIRRYPDLLVHRAIRSVIRSKAKSQRVRRHPDAQPLPKEAIYPYQHQDMSNFGEQCSMTERRADDATRDVISWLKCEYLQDKVGDTFEGIISSVVGFGLFVELKDVYVEGLIHITALPQDYYHFDAAHHRLVGERTSRVFRLGDEISVQVVRVDLDERKIDLELVAHAQKKAGKRAKATKAKAAPKAKELAEDYQREQERKGKGGVKGKAGGRGGRGGRSKGGSREAAEVGGTARRPRKRPAKSGAGGRSADKSDRQPQSQRRRSSSASKPKKTAAQPQAPGKSRQAQPEPKAPQNPITRLIKKIFG